MDRHGEKDGAIRIADGQALQALAGGPAMGLRELRDRLGLSPDTFIDVWEGRSALFGPARERLLHLLREQIVRYQDLLFRLERERAEEEAVRDRAAERPGRASSRTADGRESNAATHERGQER